MCLEISCILKLSLLYLFPIRTGCSGPPPPAQWSFPSCLACQVSFCCDWGVQRSVRHEGWRTAHVCSYWRHTPHLWCSEMEVWTCRYSNIYTFVYDEFPCVLPFFIKPFLCCFSLFVCFLNLKINPLPRNSFVSFFQHSSEPAVALCDRIGWNRTEYNASLVVTLHIL